MRAVRQEHIQRPLAVAHEHLAGVPHAAHSARQIGNLLVGRASHIRYPGDPRPIRWVCRFLVYPVEVCHKRSYLRQSSASTDMPRKGVSEVVSETM